MTGHRAKVNRIQTPCECKYTELACAMCEVGLPSFPSHASIGRPRWPACRLSELALAHTHWVAMPRSQLVHMPLELAHVCMHKLSELACMVTHRPPEMARARMSRMAELALVAAYWHLELAHARTCKLAELALVHACQVQSLTSLVCIWPLAYSHSFEYP